MMIIVVLTNDHLIQRLTHTVCKTFPVSHQASFQEFCMKTLMFPSFSSCHLIISAFQEKQWILAQYVVAKNNPRWANLSCCNFASTASPVWTF